MTEPSAPPSSEDLALREGEVVFPAAETRYVLATHDLGEVPVPSGRLRIGDTLTIVVRVPPGTLRAVVTSVAGGESFVEGRNAYLSLLVPGRTEARRGPLRPADLEAPDGGALVGVDSGFVHALDAGAAEALPPDGDAEWNSDVLESSEHDAGVGPFLAKRPESPVAVFCGSGIGDGIYEVFGGFTAEGELAALHTDFQILLTTAPPPEPTGWRAWWESNGFLVRFFGGFLLVVAAVIGIARACDGPKRPRLEPVQIQWRR